MFAQDSLSHDLGKTLNFGGLKNDARYTHNETAYRETAYRETAYRETAYRETAYRGLADISGIASSFRKARCLIAPTPITTETFSFRFSE